MTRYEIEKSGFKVETVIQYTKDDILVNWNIAIAYLNCIDEKNYVISILKLKQEYGVNNLLNGLNKLKR